MPVHVIGWAAPQVSSELGATGPVYSNEVLARTARIHEEAGFDRVLIGYFTHAPDGFLVAAHVAATTERLGLLLAHRSGFLPPTLAARKMATLDQLSNGRLAVHLIAGSSDNDQAADGDYADHDARYRRSDEYTEVLRRMWTERAPFDHEGEFYRVRGAYSEVFCVQEPHIPIYGGGGSDAAIAALAPHLDTFMLWGEPLAETAAFMARVRDAAAPFGRQPTFSVSTRPILGRTEGEAWDRARDFLARIEASPTLQMMAKRTVENAGAQRLLDAAKQGEVLDTCLYTSLATASGAPGNSTALVGTPETVAKALLEYYKLGATNLLIRGYEPLEDAEDYGRELVPRLRELVAEEDQVVASAAASR